jgi:hypothetical protein
VRVNGASPENLFVALASAALLTRRLRKLANWREAGASFYMPVHSAGEPFASANGPAGEQLLLTIGRAGVLSSRSIAAKDFEALLRLLGPPSERQRSDLKRATDIVLVEEGKLIYRPRTGEQFHIDHGAYAMVRVQATLA